MIVDGKIVFQRKQDLVTIIDSCFRQELTETHNGCMTPMSIVKQESFLELVETNLTRIMHKVIKQILS